MNNIVLAKADRPLSRPRASLSARIQWGFGTLLLCTALTLVGVGAPNTQLRAEDAAGDRIAEGKELAFDRRKGNCLACHAIDDGTLAGNLGPALVAMKARFPDREVLKNRIWDANAINPMSVMPPFGRNRILTDTEIDKIVDYLYSL